MSEKIVRTQHHPYFKQRGEEAHRLGIRKVLQDRYDLLSIAKADILSVQIYEHFFPSKLKKGVKVEGKERLDKSDFSYFFLLYIKIYVVRSLAGNHSSLTGEILAAVGDFMGGRNSSEEDKLVANFVKGEINHLYEKEYHSIWTKKYSTPQETEAMIAELIRQLYTELDKVLDTQQLPSKLKEKRQKVTFVKQSFRAILNVKMLGKRFRRRLWGQFYSTNKEYYNGMRIGIVTDNNLQENSISLPKLILESEPILTTLQHYLLRFQTSREDAQLCLQNLMVSAVKMCWEYNKKTQSFFPRVSPKSFYFSQKQLDLVYSQKELLMDGLGFQGNTKNYQLRIATQATPIGFDWYQSYLESVEEHRIVMNRKYYLPRHEMEEEQQKMPEPKQLKIQFEKEKDLLERVHAWRLLQVLYYLQTKTNLANRYYNQQWGKKGGEGGKGKSSCQIYTEMLKEIHEKGELVAQRQSDYNQNKQLQPDEQSPPTKIKLGKYGLHVFVNGQSVGKKMSVEEMRMKDGVKQIGVGGLRLGDLSDLLELSEEEDSLLEGLVVYKFKEYLYERQVLVKELSDLILHPFAFRKIINPKKYFLVYFINALEHATVHKLISQKQVELVQQLEQADLQPGRWEGKRKEEKEEHFCQLARAHLLQEMEKQIYKMNLSREFEKRSRVMADVIDKMENYKSRDDLSGKYVKNQEKQGYLTALQQIQATIQQIELLTSFENNLSLATPPHAFTKLQADLQGCPGEQREMQGRVSRELESMVKMLQSGGEMKESEMGGQVCGLKQLLRRQAFEMNKQVIQKVMSVLPSFKSLEIESEFKNIAKVHDLSIIKGNQQHPLKAAVASYFNTLFVLLVGLLTTLRESQLTEYRTNYKSWVKVEDFLPYGGKKKKRAEITIQEIEQLTKRLHLVTTTLPATI